MIDATALAKLQEAASITEAAAAIASAAASTDKVAALPSDFKLHDLEPYMPHRRSARGTFATPLIASFSAYVLTHAEDGATVFIDPRTISARAVLNLGHPGEAGHADNIAKFEPAKSAAYVALTGIATGQGVSQLAVAEFLEDWITNVEAFDSDGAIETKKAIAAVRRLTIESARKSQSEVGQLSASRSTLESISANGGGDPLPSLITFKCTPYADFTERTFGIRVGVITSNEKPALTLRVIKPEEHAEEMCLELQAAVGDALKGNQQNIEIVVGTYAKT